MDETRIVKLQAAFMAGCLKKNVLESYFPFVAKIIAGDSMRALKVDDISSAFKSRYGIEAPHTFIRSVLNVGIQKGVIDFDRKSCTFYPDGEKIKAYLFDSTEFDAKWERLKADFSAFARKMDFALSNVEEVLLECVEGLDDHVFALDSYMRNGSSSNVEYLWDTFLIKIYELNPEEYDFVSSLCLINVIKEAEFFEGDARSKFSGLKVYLDSPIIFAVLGFDEQSRVKLCRYFVRQLHEAGCQALVFDHCLTEVRGIINSANEWTHSKDYRIDRANKVSRSIFDSGRTYEDMVLEIESIVDRLNDFGICEEKTYYDTTDSRFQEDEKLLTKLLEERYRASGRTIDDNVLKGMLIDIRSIIFVYRNRRGYSATHLYDARNILISFNSALINAAATYETHCKNGSASCIPACISADTMGAVLWLYSPVQMAEYKRLQLLADCYSAVYPSRALREKYIVELEKLKNRGDIDETTFVVCKTSSLVTGTLSCLTRGQLDNFTEMTAMEVVQRVEEEQRFKLEQEISKIRIEKDEELRSAMSGKDSEIERLKLTLAETKKESYENHMRASDMEKLVKSTYEENEKIVDCFIGIISYIVLFILLAVSLGYIIGLTDVWSRQFSGNKMIDYLARGVCALLVEVVICLNRCIRTVVKIPFRIIVDRWFHRTR